MVMGAIGAAWRLYGVVMGAIGAAWGAIGSLWDGDVCYRGFMGCYRGCVG